MMCGTDEIAYGSYELLNNKNLLWMIYLCFLFFFIGSKELLLEQKVPATYLALEDVINHVAVERRLNGLDPVLNTEQYRAIVTTEMQQRYNRTFRDWAELHQATLFLHDNGNARFSQNFVCAHKTIL